MRGLSQSVWAHEDHLVAIYRRTGDTSFTHAQIADLIPCGAMLRYTVPGIFIPARDSKGVPLKGGPGRALTSGAGTPMPPSCAARQSSAITGGKTSQTDSQEGRNVYESDRTPLILTTGRWLCSKCLQRIPTGSNSCPQCGGQSFRPEYNPAALAEADRRAAARGSHHDLGRT